MQTSSETRATDASRRSDRTGHDQRAVIIAQSATMPSIAAWSAISAHGAAKGS